MHRKDFLKTTVKAGGVALTAHLTWTGPISYSLRPSIGRIEDSEIPEGVDWDKFLGSAPRRPFNKNRFIYNWHWMWDTGNGDIGNLGIYELDLIR
ncbi:MAG: hypothetical protein JJU13_05325 [Balneolaceae bacterium]|nr:hypothetical protein [Balneolaceae bacterium]